MALAHMPQQTVMFNKKISIWKRLRLLLCKNQYSIDLGRNRSEKSRIIRFKVLRGKIYIVEVA